MTGPDGHKAELEARNAAMREQINSLMDGLQRQTAQLQEAQATAMAATGSATSTDGLVKVQVNAVGIVTHVELAGSAFRSSTPDKLARSFAEAAQAAARVSRSKADAAMAGIGQDVPDLPDVFPDAPSLKGLIPEVPEIPEPKAAQRTSQASVDDDWDDFQPRSRYRKDQS